MAIGHSGKTWKGNYHSAWVPTGRTTCQPGAVSHPSHWEWKRLEGRGFCLYYVTQYETGNEAPRTVYRAKVNTAQNGYLRRKWEVGRLNSLLHKRSTFTSEEVVFGAGEEMKEKFPSVPQVRPRSVFQLAKDRGWSSVL